MQLSSFLILAASTASISLAKVVTSTKDNPVCGSDGHQSGYFADMSNCIKYYHCFEGDVQEHRTCGKSRKYDNDEAGFRGCERVNGAVLFCRGGRSVVV